METEILRISDVVRQQREIARAAEFLRQGQLVAFPTETVYGIGALGLDMAAVEALYEAKNRPASKAFSLQVADVSMVPQVAAYVPRSARLLMEKFCPGPITVVLPKAAAVPGGTGIIAGCGEASGCAQCQYFRPYQPIIC